MIECENRVCGQSRECVVCNQRMCSDQEGVLSDMCSVSDMCSDRRRLVVVVVY